MPSIIKGGRIIRTSRNLRGILDYARVSPVARIESCPIGESEGTMRVVFKDGAESRANFASYSVMMEWIAERRSWAGAVHVKQGD